MPSNPQSLRPKNGVRPSTVVVPAPASRWASRLAFLLERMSSTDASLWAARAHAGDVLNEHGHRLSASDLEQPPKAGERIHYWREVSGEQSLPVTHEVIWQCEHLVVADKPHGLPVTPSGAYARETLLARLIRELDLPDLQPIHRIDRDTCGLVVFSVRATERNAYQQLFAQRQVTKRYHAVVQVRTAISDAMQSPLGVVQRTRLRQADQFMQMQTEAGPPNAITHMRALAQAYSPIFGAIALMQLDPITGLRHQLRVQLSDLGLPILHDGIYPQLKPQLSPMDALRDPLQLRASQLAFNDPITGKAHAFESRRHLATWVKESTN